MEPPPSRYRVEEQDGRLVVIDNGEPLEPLVKHSHEVITPGKRRRRAKKRAISASPMQAQNSTNGTGQTITVPIGPKGETREVAIDGAMIGRFLASLFGLMLLFVFGGPLIIMVLVFAIAVGAAKRGEERILIKAVRSWGRWVAGI